MRVDPKVSTGMICLVVAIKLEAMYQEDLQAMREDGYDLEDCPLVRKGWLEQVVKEVEQAIDGQWAMVNCGAVDMSDCPEVGHGG